jgi:hypothetical protein
MAFMRSKIVDNIIQRSHAGRLFVLDTFVLLRRRVALLWYPFVKYSLDLFLERSVSSSVLSLN